MTTISYTEAREHLASVWDQTVASREPIILSRRGSESVVILPLEEWRGIEETAYLLRSPANAKRLFESLDRLNRGEGEAFTMEELKEKFDLN